MQRFVLTTLFLLIIAATSKAQNEFYITWHGDSLSLDGFSHVVDGAGNLYILGSLSPFDSSGGPSPYTYGNALLKIDKNNTLLWEKVYYCLGWQMLLPGDAVYVPYNAYVGLSTCSNVIPGFAKETTLNAALLANAVTGDTIKNNVLYDGKNCGTDGIRYSYTDKNKYIYNIYTNDSFTIAMGSFSPSSPYYIQKIDTNFNTFTDTLFNPANDLLYNDTMNDIDRIIYDTFSNNIVIADTHGLNIYNENWELINTIDFKSYNAAYTNMYDVTIAYNADYYAVNFEVSYYDGVNEYIYSYLVVITKDGQLISSRPSYLFHSVFSYFPDNMILTKDNNIFGVTHIPGFGVNIEDSVYLNYAPKPLTLVEMDLFQNVKRKIQLGRPGTCANKITVTPGNEVIVTGTVYFSYFDSVPGPDMIYYYRQSIDQIPLLTTGSSLCDNIVAYPNPAKNSINVTSSDFDLTYHATTELFDLLGQKLSTSVFDTKTLSVDLTLYPPGIYFLRTRNDNASCVTKIEKQ